MAATIITKFANKSRRSLDGLVYFGPNCLPLDGSLDKGGLPGVG